MKTSRQRFLEFVNHDTGEVARRVDVTGRSDREVERCMRGMLINIGDRWFVRDTADNPKTWVPGSWTSRRRTDGIMSGLADLVKSLAAASPKIRRGQVWCRACGSTRKVDGKTAIQNGWPKCCDITMTIDSPEERAGMNGAPSDEQ